MNTTTLAAPRRGSSGRLGAGARAAAGARMFDRRCERDCGCRCWRDPCFNRTERRRPVPGATVEDYTALLERGADRRRGIWQGRKDSSAVCARAAGSDKAAKRRAAGSGALASRAGRRHMRRAPCRDARGAGPCAEAIYATEGGRLPMAGRRGAEREGAARPRRTCSVCGQAVDGDIRLLNHMMERHGFRNPDTARPDRNSRGY